MEYTRLPGPWDFPGKNTGVGCHFFLPGIFLIQGSNLDWQAVFTTEPPGKPLPSHRPISFMSLEICLFLTFTLCFSWNNPLKWFLHRVCQSFYKQSFYNVSTHTSGMAQPWLNSTISYWYRCILSLLLCCYIRVPLNSLVHTSFGLFTTATMGTILRSELLSQTVNAIYCQITLDGIYTIDILHSHQQCMKAHISPQPSQQNTL